MVVKRILIDGDSCGVLAKIETTAKKYNIESHIYCDTTRIIKSDISTVHIVDKAPDSADFSILKDCQKNDIIITTDAGLAAMALSLGATILNPKGFEFTNSNINSYLASRHLRKQAVRKTGRQQVSVAKMPEKRMPFAKLLTSTIKRMNKEEKI